MEGLSYYKVSRTATCIRNISENSYNLNKLIKQFYDLVVIKKRSVKEKLLIRKILFTTKTIMLKMVYAWIKKIRKQFLWNDILVCFLHTKYRQDTSKF